MDLFSDVERKYLDAAAPLAVRMRPRCLEDFVGQEEFIACGKLLWRMLKADRLTSLLFYGPPGTGKTTLANVIAHQTAAEFIPTNAATIGVSQIRTILKASKDRLAAEGRKTVLFLDEIHRFSRSQQDVLLDDVEDGTIILIGATTENPFFSVVSALVSRSTIFQFKPLSQENICKLIGMALSDKKRGLGKYNISITDQAIEYLALMSDGDARRALTALEIGVLSQAKMDKTAQQQNSQQDEPASIDDASIDGGSHTIVFDKALAMESTQRKTIVADRSGDSHYNLASALQKSMRGSDPDATVYWLARLIVGGEDPRFIARRIAVCAAEDVGNADPMATVLASAAVQISEFIGFPEAQLPLAQAAIYIACSPKSNRSAKAIWGAVADVENGRTAPVPDHLRDAHYKSAKKLGHGIGYEYPHDHPGGYVPQVYLPQEVKKTYYQPTHSGNERRIAEYLDRLQRVLDKMSPKP